MTAPIEAPSTVATLTEKIWLGVYLAVVSIVALFVLIWWWPSEVMTATQAVKESALAVAETGLAKKALDDLRTAHTQAEKTVDEAKKVESDTSKRVKDAAGAINNAASDKKARDTAVKVHESAVTALAAAEKKASDVKGDLGTAEADLAAKTAWAGVAEKIADTARVIAEFEARRPTYPPEIPHIYRDTIGGAGYMKRLLLLIIAAAVLGSCIHAMTSYYDYIGNRRYMSSWLPWYLFRPLHGAVLAVLFYLVLWSGTQLHDSIASSSNFGWIIGMAGLVGLFSKQATDKLNDVFSTLIKTDADASRKDKFDRNNLPRITSVEPIDRHEESGVVTINLIGERFMAGSHVRCNASPRKTTFSSANLLMADLRAEDVHQPRKLELQVVNPDPPGGESPSFDLLVHPVPFVDPLKPREAVKLDVQDCQTTGGLAKIIVRGTNFVPSSVVQYGPEGADRETKFISDTVLHAFLHKSDRTISVPSRIRVRNPLPGGGTSDWVGINTLPVLTSVDVEPQDVNATGPVTLIVRGSNFVNPPGVWHGGQKVSPDLIRFVSDRELRVTLPAEQRETAGTVAVKVCNPDPVGGIVELSPYPAPTISRFEPLTAKIGESIRLTIIGTGFGKQTVVRFNQTQLTPDPKTLTETSLTVDLSTAETANVGDKTIAVTNPNPGGGEARSVQPFKVVQP